MKISMKNWALITLAAALTACQAMPYQPYARDVKKKPGQSGVIALKPGHQTEDQEKAKGMMSSNCGTTPVKVIEEGEVAVGQEVKSNADTTKRQGYAGTQVGSLFGLPITSGGANPTDSTSGTATTTAIKEWQISYECVTPATKKVK